MSQPIIAVLAPGGMGSKIALRISQTGGGTILTNLEGRSEATRRRAEESGMTHASYPEIVSQATYILSVVPPKDAFEVAEQVVAAAKTSPLGRQIIFADCNAINPDSARQMSQLFEGTNIKFIDGAIVGPPPTQTYNPGIYVSAGPADELALDEFVALGTKHGLNIIPLKGEGSGVGDASALKMAHAGIVKGAIGLFVSMILAANASSSSTAKGLLHALSISQPSFIDLMVRLIPQSIPKAYRFVKEMEEVAGFVGGDEGRIYEGIEKVFEKIAMANKEAPNGDAGDAAKLLQFVEEAKDVLAQDEVGSVSQNRLSSYMCYFSTETFQDKETIEQPMFTIETGSKMPTGTFTPSV